MNNRAPTPQQEQNTDAVPQGTPYAAENICRQCRGTGKVGSETCLECKGIGKVHARVGGWRLSRDQQTCSSQRPTNFASQDEALQFFDSLPPVTPDDLIGLWPGHGIRTGHPLDGVLENLGWYGKRFNPDLRADALLFRAGERKLTPLDPALIPLKLAFRLSRFGRTRIARNWFTFLQKGLRARGPVASIKPLPFRGKVSAAMVYDRQPIIDHFRRLDDETILGAMTLEGESRLYFFLLSRP